MLTDPQHQALVAFAKQVMPAKTADKDRERWIFFVVRRGAYYIGFEGWAANSNELKAAVTGDIAKAQNFVSAELGTGQKSLANRTPAHLDLSDACRARTDLSAGDVKPIVTDTANTRKALVAKIAIRALAAHSDLWTTGGDVDVDPAREIVDRRLRMVERMAWSVDAGTGARTWKVTAKTSWTDGFRTRVFEYPYINQSPDVLIKNATAHGVTLPLHDGSREAPYQQTAVGEDWDWLRVKFSDDTLRELLWDDPPPFPEVQTADDPDPVTGDRSLVNARLPIPALRWAFKVSPADSHALRFFAQPGQVPTAQTPLTLSQAIDALFSDSAAPKTDYWNRAWIYCDHAISAVHLEALLFARRRRLGTTAATSEIDALATRIPPGTRIHSTYVWLGAIPDVSISQPGGQHGGLLDGRSGNEYFRTLRKRPDSFEVDHDLEIGDHVIFFNSAIYDLLTAGALRLENATITDIGARADGTLDTGAVRFEGHGMSGGVDAYAKEFFDTIDDELGEARNTITAAVKKDSTTTHVRLATGHHTILWAPYPLTPAATATFKPWWLVYPLVTPANTDFVPIATSIRDAVLEVPGTYGVDLDAAQPALVTGVRPPRGGTPTRLSIPTPANKGYTPFDDVTTELTTDKVVLFPLTAPTGAKDQTTPGLDAWGRYLRRRATGPVATTLNLLKPDSSLIPGLFDADGRVWATSPRVRP